MTREEVKVEIAGLTHSHEQHMMVNKQQQQQQDVVAQNNTAPVTANNHNSPSHDSNQNTTPALSTIAILRRHPMYDSLVLVKRYRACLNGYSLEFPTSDVTHNNNNNTTNTTTTKTHSPNGRDCCKTKLVSVYLDGDDPIYQCHERRSKNGLLFDDGEIVHVPMNGLLDRLDNYDRHGVAVDGRVYAFAMGLKTAERFLRTSSMKEVQETPPI